ncbi:MAG: dTMP kinase [Xanthomonadales bacterium]|jgi:dTMP kinase|nr:dTMP kinase [Xanthomonadales bacterium]
MFITIEGGEGAGKSTMMERMVTWLEDRGHKVVPTREPGGTELAEKLRAILLDKNTVGLSDQAELLLMFASRAQHLAEVIRPALQRGETVLCDRFTDATWAYQGGGRGLPLDDIAILERLVHGDLQPDLTVLLDLPVAQGLRRASRRGEADRFEEESSGFFERVRQAYLRRAESAPGRFAVVDASGSMEEVWSQVDGILQARLPA